MENGVINNNNDVIEIDLQELLGLLWHKAWAMALAMIFTGLIGFGISAFVIAPKYESTTSIYILNKQNDNAMTYSDTQLATQLTKDYEKLIVDRYVLETVIAEYELDMEYETFKSKVSVLNENDTRILDITVKDEDPYRAKSLANAIREAASVHIKEVTDVEAVNVVNEANLAREASEPSIMKWTAVAALIGLFLCAAIVIICYLMDDTIKTADDVERHLGISTLAIIPSAGQDGKSSRSKKKARRKEAERESYLQKKREENANRITASLEKEGFQNIEI